MKQCYLSRGITKQIVWLPEEYAVKNKYLKIKDENGWKIEEVYSLNPFLLTSDGRSFNYLLESIS